MTTIRPSDCVILPRAALANMCERLLFFPRITGGRKFAIVDVAGKEVTLRRVEVDRLSVKFLLLTCAKVVLVATVILPVVALLVRQYYRRQYHFTIQENAKAIPEPKIEPSPAPEKPVKLDPVVRPVMPVPIGEMPKLPPCNIAEMRELLAAMIAAAPADKKSKIPSYYNAENDYEGFLQTMSLLLLWNVNDATPYLNTYREFLKRHPDSTLLPQLTLKARGHSLKVDQTLAMQMSSSLIAAFGNQSREDCFSQGRYEMPLHTSEDGLKIVRRYFLEGKVSQEAWSTTQAAEVYDLANFLRLPDLLTAARQQLVTQLKEATQQNKELFPIWKLALQQQDTELQALVIQHAEQFRLTDWDVKYLPTDIRVQVKSVPEFQAALANNQKMQSLALLEGGNLKDIETSIGQAVADSPSLRCLTLDRVSCDGVMLGFFQALRDNRGLTFLRLQGLHIISLPDAFFKFLECTRTLTHLDLFFNPLTHGRGYQLVQAVDRNRTLTHLSLQGTQLPDNDLAALGDVLVRNKTLRWLSLKDNKFDPQAKDAFIAKIATHQPTLVVEW